MAIKETVFTLDLTREGRHPVVKFRLNDNKVQKITFRLTNNGREIDLEREMGDQFKPVFECIFRDKTFKRDEDRGNWEIKRDTTGKYPLYTFTYFLTDEVINKSGIACYYFALETPEGLRISTPTLKMVIDCDFKEDGKPSENYVSEFEKLLKEAERVKQTIKGLDETLKEVLAGGASITEVIRARENSEGVHFKDLKERLDTENKSINKSIKDINSFIGKREDIRPEETIIGKIKNTDSIIKSVKEIIGANVFDFGAKGDGVTDDSAAFQAAIDSLGVFKYNHPSPSSVIQQGGGRVIIPKPKKFYLIKQPLKYSSSMRFVGEGWNTVIKFVPEAPANLFEGDRSKYASFNSHHDVEFENLNIVGDHTDSTIGNAKNGIDGLNVRYIKVRNCVITGFEVGIKFYRDNTSSYGYFNTIEYCYIYNNILNVYTESNGMQIIGGELSNNHGWRKSDYMLQINSAGCVISGTTIEGSPNVAQVLDRGYGTSYTGNYTETTEGETLGQKPFIEVEINKGFTSMSIQGLYNATISKILKFKNLFAETDPTKSYDVNYGISLNSNGSFVNSIKNQNFKNFLLGWTPRKPNSVDKISLQSTYLFGSPYGISIRKVDNEENNVSQSFQVTSKQVYITALCKVSTGNEKDINFRAWDFGETGAQYGSVVVDYGNGWFLTIISLSSLQKTRGSVAIGLRDKAPVGSTLVVTSVQAYTQGFPIFPPYRESAVKLDRKPRWIEDGYYYKGDVISNSNPIVENKSFVKEWVCIEEGFGKDAGATPVGKFAENIIVYTE
ncbi:glycosyl hydrolase family 28-related protein [Bacillus cereus group sp. BY9-3LC]|uniref:glycosyl hydrolase family 28-related protein n=1 Tax=Bacillus cereus group sp. BY9-3LC TaxID=3018075 RepID=UPI0022E06675|nr:glycosyl hydrolase family 28-related protein [Bacillus cereus group sp. BY9-3LC]MDA1777448.1 glycosyl hydrolase family 28-related protein [Bacillus cereus group sp. BY9-3LC]